MNLHKNINILKNQIFKLFDKYDFKKSIDELNDIHLKSIQGSLKSFFINYLTNLNYLNLLILVNDIEDSIEFINDLETLEVEIPVFNLFEILKHENIDENNINHILLNLVSKINQSQPSIIILNSDMLEFNVISPNNFNETNIKLEINQRYNFNDLVKNLNDLNFQRVDYVSNIGEFSIRGGIVDIFPISNNNPFRIEFWGDDIESIREFDTISQRSIKSLNSIDILTRKIENKNITTKLIDIISKDYLFIFQDSQFYNSDLNYDIKNTKIVFNSLESSNFNIKSKNHISFNFSVKDLSSFILENKDLYQFYYTAESKNHIERLYNILQSNLEIENEFTEDEAFELLNKFNWIPKFLSEGFILNDIYVYAEHQIFNRNKKTSINSKKKSKILLQELTSLKNGDYIVHEDKGIAKFQGFRNITIGDSTQDCIQLEFEGGDLLYVNMNYINKIQRYSAQEGIVPKISKLGSNDWDRKKLRHKKKIKEIARELINLYAQRKMQPGFAFEKDSIWQKEFEASFIYDDTIDQINATEDIKKDMESSMPMDRLLCGDVGFGKTEIAIRAAFKAVQSGKQVAILVPTTILAHQHFMSFSDRLNRYPVKIEVLSRFVSKSKQNDIVQNLMLGKVDILIGTHRILSKDIEFKNLGLLVIDEEQRFGVAAKEKLRHLKVSIDTLTLTATPIPRTLNFSLLGARDLSIMETPPKNRLPVDTEIIEWDDEKIVSIIEYEIKRGGQVFFVNDKIQDLELIMYELKKLLPKNKFALAHGQLQSKDLESIMQKFISGEIDVLCTTKIVESGLDIPNANTMIINKAQNFGLAELYQLRGRVGRSGTQAHCYLVIPSNYKLNQTSLKRLQAIEEFTDLGSGFQIALRDMEIRGAGNLLGSEQSGAIYDIGFELYQKVLDEAVNELKNEEFKELFNLEDNKLNEIYNYDVSIDFNEDCLIPEDYIHSDTERFELYQKLYKFDSNKQIIDVQNELKDKYGNLPKEFINLLYIIKVRIQAVKLGIDKIIIKNNYFILELPKSENELFYKLIFPVLLDYLQTLNNSQLLQNKNKLSIKVPINSKESIIEILWKLNKTIEEVEYE